MKAWNKDLSPYSHVLEFRQGRKYGGIGKEQGVRRKSKESGIMEVTRRSIAFQERGGG